MFWFSPKFDNQGTFGWRFTRKRRVAGADTGGGGAMVLVSPPGWLQGGGLLHPLGSREKKFKRGKILKILISVAKFC